MTESKTETASEAAKGKPYETVYILRPDLTDEGTKKANEKIAGVISRFHGELKETKDLGKKPLMYRIAKHLKGHYFQLNYTGNGVVVDELERALRLSEDVIRFLTVRDEGCGFSVTAKEAAVNTNHEEASV